MGATPYFLVGLPVPENSTFSLLLVAFQSPNLKHRRGAGLVFRLSAVGCGRFRRRISVIRWGGIRRDPVKFPAPAEAELLDNARYFVPKGARWA
jgi:hypothetical protein